MEHVKKKLPETPPTSRIKGNDSDSDSDTDFYYGPLFYFDTDTDSDTNTKAKQCQSAIEIRPIIEDNASLTTSGEF